VTRRVLVVEDQPAVAKAIQVLLEIDGIPVSSCSAACARSTPGCR
jgi:hypothetical protein